MPAYPNIIPDWLKPENASVLDPAWKRGLRKVGSLIGADDPAGQVMGTVGPMMTAGEGLGPLASKAVGGLKGFYSRLSNAMGSLPEMVNPAKALSIAKNQASGEEIGYRKLGEFLGTQPPSQRMPKAAILQHLEQNPPPHLEVKTYRTAASGTVTPEERAAIQPPTYSQYQVPGGQNYREYLIKLPEKEPMTLSRAAAPGEYSEPADVMNPRYVPPYTSMHWPEDPNTLVHVRSAEHRLPIKELPQGYSTLEMGDFSGNPPRHYVVGPRGQTIEPGAATPSEAIEQGLQQLGPKGRLIENIQSDWHQAGAREGYAPNEVNALNDQWDSLRRAYEGDPKGVPDAPFKQNWADLALKQQLLDLAEDPELSWIGITPGSESVKRGELLKPEFHDVTLPRKLEDLLKPFGGRVEQGQLNIPSGKRPLEYVQTRSDPEERVRQVIDYNYQPDPVNPGATVIASALPRGLSDDALENAIYIRDIIRKQQLQPVQLPFQLAHLTPEMKAAILKKGFPLMSLIGLINAAPQNDYEK